MKRLWTFDPDTWRGHLMFFLAWGPRKQYPKCVTAHRRLWLWWIYREIRLAVRK